MQETPDLERQAYERVKRDILSAVEQIRLSNPDAARYLEQHLVMDEERMTFAYTGDDRLKLNPIAL